MSDRLRIRHCDQARAHGQRPLVHGSVLVDPTLLDLSSTILGLAQNLRLAEQDISSDKRVNLSVAAWTMARDLTSAGLAGKSSSKPDEGSGLAHSKRQRW